jgi:manganese/iron transport system substrate-binding protein
MKPTGALCRACDIALIAAAIGGFFMLWAGAAHASAPEAQRRMILCSTTQVADFARNVVGNLWDVECVLGPGVDPHTYMPAPKDARLAAKADLCLQNGLHLEGKNWMANLAHDAGKPVVNCTDGIKPLELEAGGRKISDPHAWFSPKNAAVYVNNIVHAVSRMDPSRKDQYEAAAKLYLGQLRVLDGWIREQVHSIPQQARILVTSHDAFNYFAVEYGFRNRAPVGWSTGAELGAGMTPERRREVVESIKASAVKAVFIETSVNPKLVSEIAVDAGVRIGGELYSDSMGGAGSAAETYLGMMRHNVISIVMALK